MIDVTLLDFVLNHGLSAAAVVAAVVLYRDNRRIQEERIADSKAVIATVLGEVEKLHKTSGELAMLASKGV